MGPIYLVQFNLFTYFFLQPLLTPFFSSRKSRLRNLMVRILMDLKMRIMMIFFESEVLLPTSPLPAVTYVRRSVPLLLFSLF